MRRVAAFVLALCAGCASAGGDTLLEDSLWGDVKALFSSDDNSSKRYMPTYTTGYSSSAPNASAVGSAKANP
jgi:hypothetical protein